MDLFVEQLIREKRGGRYFFAVFGLSVAALVLLTLAVMMGGMLLAFAVVGIGYGWYWCTAMLLTEYEYCVTNGDIDIDRIRGKRRRLRLVSVRGDKIESLAPYTPDCDLSRFNRVVKCTTGEAADLWYFTYHSKKNGHTVVVFQPNARVLAALVEGLSPLLRREVQKTCEFPVEE
ncbi:MAG: hypothetical protein E7552_06565 [Ruminococcaceae bacterium]|nr:hypothetical protein [Oscillospiraceae bacterium]